MSVHLIGGGRDDERTAALLRPFVREATASAPDGTVVVLLVVEGDHIAPVERFRNLAIAAGADRISVVTTEEGGVFGHDALPADAHGLLVGGGLTPAYLEALAPLRDRIRERVADGLPYAGFSAGAAIAAEHALVGGWRLDGRAVAPEDTAEDLDALTVRPGLGLVPGSVEVHAAQWGTLSRLVAAVGSGMTPHGTAVDEHTSVTDDGRVRGWGRRWDASRGAGGVVVSMLTASAPDDDEGATRIG